MLVRADQALPRGPRGERPDRRWGRREWTWVVVVMVGFVLAVEAAAIYYDLRGPVRLLSDDFFGRPVAGEVKVAGLALAVMCMPRRFRGWFLATVVGVEILFNIQRYLADEHLHFGNGVMWALAGLAVYALWQLKGRDQEVTLKAVGIAAILIVTSRVAGVWLELTMQALPFVADWFVEVADRALGSPSWVMGRFVNEHEWYLWLITKVYTYLPVGAAVVAYFQLRRSSTEGFPRHHIVRSFILIGAIGPVVYFLFPVVGPAYAFGGQVPGAAWLDVWPNVVPTSLEPISAYYSQLAPRNCMPSLHTAWATAILLHALRGPRLLKAFGVFWFVCTLSATLGIGAHYGIDLVAGFVFALTLETALVRPEDGWHHRRLLTIAGGAGTFAAILVATRYLSVPMAQSGPVAAVLLLGSTAAMAFAYYRVAFPSGGAVRLGAVVDGAVPAALPGAVEAPRLRA